MKRILFALMVGWALVAVAQRVTVTEQSRLLPVEGPAYYPVLSHDGEQLLFTGESTQGLNLYNFSTRAVTRVSDAPGAGYGAVFGGDGNIYYVSQERRANNLIYRTGHRYDQATGRSAVVLEAQHGAMQPVAATRGAALKSKARNYSSANAVGNAVYTQGSEVIIDIAGRERRFSPVESWAGYLWASLSPDGKRVAFFAAEQGIIIIDLDGNVLARLGNYEMPCWYDDNYLVAQNTTDDGRQFTSSQILLLKADGTFKHELTRPTSMTMQPTAGGGKIVFTTIDGNMTLMKINIQP